jgi:hypothetical protein
MCKFSMIFTISVLTLIPLVVLFITLRHVYDAMKAPKKK